MTDILFTQINLGLFLLAFALGLTFTFAIRYLARKFKFVEHGGFRKINRKPIPLLGGLGIALPFIGFLIFVSIYNFHEILPSRILTWSAFSFILVTIGIIDDIWGMKAKVKLFGQLIIAILTVFFVLHNNMLHQIYLPFFGLIHLHVAVSSIISIFWIVGLINAFNLIDGIDGLASGVAFFVSLTLALLALISHNYLILSLSIFLAGNLLAFLCFNFNPATIFLGDTGSMFIGYAISVITLIGQHKYRTFTIILAPIIALGLPIFEVIISMIRRYLRGLPVFVGDSYHTHHRLLERGFSQRKVVLILYLVSFLLSVWAVLSIILPRDKCWISFVLFFATLLWTAWLAGYLHFGILKKVIYRRQQNILLNAFAKYAILSFNKNHHDDNYNSLLTTCCFELGLSYLEIMAANGKILLASKAPSSKRLKFHEIKVNSLMGYAINIKYVFAHIPTEMEQHDVSICLANIFTHIYFHKNKNEK